MYVEPYKRPDITVSDITQLLGNNQGHGKGLDAGSLEGLRLSDFVLKDDAFTGSDINYTTHDDITEPPMGIIEQDNNTCVWLLTQIPEHNKKYNIEFDTLRVIYYDSSQTYIRFVDYSALFNKVRFMDSIDGHKTMLTELNTNTTYYIRFFYSDSRTGWRSHYSDYIEVNTTADYNYTKDPEITFYNNKKKQSTYPSIGVSVNITDDFKGVGGIRKIQCIVIDKETTEVAYSDIQGQRSGNIHIPPGKLEPNTDYIIAVRWFNGFVWSNWISDTFTTHYKGVIKRLYAYTYYSSGLSYVANTDTATFDDREGIVATFPGRHVADNRTITSISANISPKMSYWLRRRSYPINSNTGVYNVTDPTGPGVIGAAAALYYKNGTIKRAMTYGGINIGSGFLVRRPHIVEYNGLNMYTATTSTGSWLSTWGVAFHTLTGVLDYQAAYLIGGVAVGGDAAPPATNPYLFGTDEMSGFSIVTNIYEVTETGIVKHMKKAIDRPTSHAAATLVDTFKILYFGGVDKYGTPSKRAYLVDVKARTVTRLPDLPFPIYNHRAVTVRGDRVIVYGGVVSTLYNTATGTDYIVNDLVDNSGCVYDYDWRRGKMEIIDILPGFRERGIMGVPYENNVVVRGGGKFSTGRSGDTTYSNSAAEITYVYEV